MSEVTTGMWEAAKAIFSIPAVQAAGTAGLVAIVVSLLVVNGFAYIGDFGFKEWAAERKIRRDFADATGKQIATLANEHYWAIANAAGTLSAGLRDYLQALETSLYLVWNPREHALLLAEDKSFETFPSLVKLVWTLHNFQFIGSNDYILPNYSSGRHLRRLYNNFRESLALAREDGGDDLATGLLQWRTEGGDCKFDIDGALEAASRRINSGSAEQPQRILADPKMESLRKLWGRWLRDDLPAVLNATTSLEAFSRLLQHEIAELHEDWFRDRRYESELEAAHRAVKRKTWFGALTRTELATLAVAREQGDFMTALRRAGGTSPELGWMKDGPEPPKGPANAAPPSPPSPPSSGSGASGPTRTGADTAVDSRPKPILPEWVFSPQVL